MNPEIREMYDRAIRNYGTYYNIPEGNTNIMDVQSTPENIEGWAKW